MIFEELPTRTYSSESPLKRPRVFLRDMRNDLVKSRELAWQLTVRDFKALYRQSYAGYLWAFVPPLLASATFMLLRSGNVVSFGDTSIPYPAFVMIGTILWQVFVDALNNPIRVMQTSAQMMTKINFPREALIISSIQTSFINLLVRLLILVPILFWFQFKWNVTLLLFPFGALSLILLGTTIGLFFGTIGMLYNDIQRGIQAVTNLWMFLTPVVFPSVREGVIGKIMMLNPVTPVLVTTRDWLTGSQPIFLQGYFIVMILTLVGLLFSWVIFRIFLPQVIERLGM